MIHGISNIHMNTYSNESLLHLQWTKIDENVFEKSTDYDYLLNLKAPVKNYNWKCRLPSRLLHSLLTLFD